MCDDRRVIFASCVDVTSIPEMRAKLVTRNDRMADRSARMRQSIRRPQAHQGGRQSPARVIPVTKASVSARETWACSGANGSISVANVPPPFHTLQEGRIG